MSNNVFILGYLRVANNSVCIEDCFADTYDESYISPDRQNSQPDFLYHEEVQTSKLKLKFAKENNICSRNVKVSSPI